MTPRVIEGGVSPDEPAPIVWNRLPFDDQRRALVIRNGFEFGVVDLAWDDGRPFLIGIRSVRLPADETALEAWKLHAELCKAAVRDERTPRAFELTPQGTAGLRAAMAAELQRRNAKRDARPADDLDLFNPTRREAVDLFGES